MNNEKVLTNHENEDKIVGLIDPMAFDSEEELEAKKKKWMDIFDRNPDLSNLILNIHADLGDDGLYKYLFTFIRDNFSAYMRKVDTLCDKTEENSDK